MTVVSIKIDETLDITTIECPVTIAKTLIKLDDMQEGQILEVFVDEGKPIENLPQIESEGHKIIEVEQVAGKKYRVLIEKGKLVL